MITPHKGTTYQRGIPVAKTALPSNRYAIIWRDGTVSYFEGGETRFLHPKRFGCKYYPPLSVSEQEDLPVWGVNDVFEHISGGVQVTRDFGIGLCKLYGVSVEPHPCGFQGAIGSFIVFWNPKTGFGAIRPTDVSTSTSSEVEFELVPMNRKEEDFVPPVARFQPPPESEIQGPIVLWRDGSLSMICDGVTLRKGAMYQYDTLTDREILDLPDLNKFVRPLLEGDYNYYDFKRIVEMKTNASVPKSTYVKIRRFFGRGDWFDW